MLNVGDNLPVVSEDYQVNIVAIIGMYISSPRPDKAEVIVYCLKPCIGREYIDSVPLEIGQVF